MRHSLTVSALFLVGIATLAPGSAAAGGLDDFLKEVNVQASVDIGSFKADLSATFDLSNDRVDTMFTLMSKPSDVYMCLRVGEIADQPIDRVVAEYKAHRGQGWGVIAKNLGIKPGSAEFHALKANRLSGDRAAAGKPGKGKGGKSRR